MKRRRPYRIRTWLRGVSPWWLINLGIFSKGSDCNLKGGEHEWVRFDDCVDLCRHCNACRPYSVEWWKRWKAKHGVDDNFSLISSTQNGEIKRVNYSVANNSYSKRADKPRVNGIKEVKDVPWLTFQVKQWLKKQWGRMDIVLYLESVSDANGQVECYSRRYPETYVYLKDSMPIGTVSLAVDELDERPQYNPWICCLFVAKNFRGKGIGKTLINHAGRVALANDESEIFMLIDYTLDCIPSGWEKIDDIIICGKKSRIVRKSLL